MYSGAFGAYTRIILTLICKLKANNGVGNGAERMYVHIYIVHIYIYVCVYVCVCAIVVVVCPSLLFIIT